MIRFDALSLIIKLTLLVSDVEVLLAWFPPLNLKITADVSLELLSIILPNAIPFSLNNVNFVFVKVGIIEFDKSLIIIFSLSLTIVSVLNDKSYISKLFNEILDKLSLIILELLIVSEVNELLSWICPLYLITNEERSIELFEISFISLLFWSVNVNFVFTNVDVKLLDKSIIPKLVVPSSIIWVALYVVEINDKSYICKFEAELSIIFDML